MDKFFINSARLGMLGAQIRDLSAIDPAALAEFDRCGGDAADYQIVNGTAVIAVRGALVSAQISGWYWYGGSTYESLLATVEMAVNDPAVDRILMAFNTPGGTVTGCAEAASRLDTLSNRKDIWAHCAMADSAGYWLAAATNRIIVDPTGEVGSIGVITTHMDMSKMLQEYGIDVTHIFSGKHKADGSPFAPLSESAKGRIQSDCDHLRSVFVDSVASYRKTDRETLMKTEALTYIGALAVDSGLADETGFFTDVLNTMAERTRSGINSSTKPATASKEEKSNMAKKDLKSPKVRAKASEDEEDKNKKAADDSAPEEEKDEEEVEDKKADEGEEGEKKSEGNESEDSASAERSRIDSILNHKEAAGRDDLARHLALKTGMSATEAGKILAASSKAEKKTANPLAAAMNNNGNPKLGAGAPAGNSEKSSAVIEDMRRRYGK